MFDTLRRFFLFCDKENRKKFYYAIILGVVNSFFIVLKIVAVSVMLQSVIEATTQGTAFDTAAIVQSVLIMLASIAGGIVTKKYVTMWQTEGGYRTSARKRIEIAEHLRYLPMGYFNTNSLGEITTVTTNTMELLGDIATRAVMMVLQGLLDSLLIIVMIAFFNWKVALTALAGFVLFQLVNVLMRLSVRGISDRKHEVDTAQVSDVLEFIQGIAEVKAYNLTGSRSKELNQVIDECRKVNSEMELRCIPISAIQSLIAKLTGVGIMAMSIGLYLSGEMTVAHCSIMLICSFMLFTSLEAGGNYSALLRTIDLAVGKASKILALPTIDIEGKEIVPKDLTIAARDIAFAYAKKRVIDGVSLSVPPKATVAFVGPSGSGKTTLCHLLARFWDVDQGKVTLGGVDVKEYSMDALMKNFSFVFQNVYLFHDTIANNIRFGNPDAPMEAVIEAAKKACCHEFIAQLPNGYDTVIGENGASLSGGEKQRISIARAILKDSPIIILDEATANVDPENERELMNAVSALTKEKTVMMIAHRLKTVLEADLIYVVDNGKIVDAGTHKELMGHEGIYSRFIASRKKAVSWKL